ncbi:MAG: nucleotidyltransferase family protein [Robiginitomaculum sp.]|nr:nucleotidyltransferase family protein [Robiginitomaculum sp.]
MDHLRFANAPRAEQEAMFKQLVLSNPLNAEILRRIPELPLPQGMLVSGCLYQSIWNGLLGHDPARGILDYDLAYYDDSDLSYEAEDVIIKACAKAFADLDADIEVRNQARVHLWFKDHFGLDYAPLPNAAEALSRYMSPCNAVAIEPVANGEFALHAPFGFDDVFAFVVRPRGDGTQISVASYAKKTKRMKALWPELTIVPLG